MTISFDILYCDDIRREDNGKLILVGYYSNDIILGKPKEPMFLTTLIRLAGLEKGQHDNRLTFVFEGEVLAEAEGVIAVDNEFVAQAILPHISFNFATEGVLQAMITFTDGREVSAPPINIIFAKSKE